MICDGAGQAEGYLLLDSLLYLASGVRQGIVGQSETLKNLTYQISIRRGSLASTGAFTSPNAEWQI